jgi:hypothetical protein
MTAVRSSPLAAVMVLSLSLLIALGAAAAAYFEGSPFIYAGSTEAERAASLVSGDLQPGLSLGSHEQVLESCVRLFASVYVKTRPTAVRDHLAEACRGLARDSVADMPSYSFGWFVAAETSFFLHDSNTFNDALVRSQQAGSYEQWIAELRVALVEDHYDETSDAVRDGHASDLKMLVQSRHGVTSIARRYVDDPGFRERITALVETLPAADQRRFVQLVRQVANSQ